MTTITFDLPDDLAADLVAKAASWQMSIDEVLHEAALQLMLSDENPREPIALSEEELAAFHAAQLDLAEGRTVSHDEAMARFRQVLNR
jgi:predicted transcriptional regulator